MSALPLRENLQLTFTVSFPIPVFPSRDDHHFAAKVRNVLRRKLGHRDEERLVPELAQLPKR